MKIMSLMKFDGLREIENVPVESDSDSQLIDNLLNHVNNRELPDISVDDLNAIFYVGGYIAMSLIRRKKCRSCETILKFDEDLIYPNTSSIEEEDTYLEKCFHLCHFNRPWRSE